MRPLKTGERREGGLAWNILKNLAISWTVCMGLLSASTFVSTTRAMGQDFPDHPIATTAGVMLGMGLLGAIWLFPTMGAVLLGYMLKKSTVEEGPTGPLAEHRAASV